MAFQHPGLLWVVPHSRPAWGSPGGGLDIWIWPMEACMSPALGYLDLQLDLPRNEGPTAEATRLTDKRKV